MFTKEGWEDPSWEEPEELSLLQRAIDIVLEKLEGNHSSGQTARPTNRPKFNENHQ